MRRSECRYRNGDIRVEDSIFIVRPKMRTLMLLVALASGSGLAGCEVNYAPVNLNAIENPRQWDQTYRGARRGGHRSDRAEH